ncbi:MAG: hypothetical protein M3R21_06420 [Candidatus Dormibacteraeota bacterium]|nr:hypothetical protein [Candidatus Dormibacteraeota bacterium]
MTVLRQRDFGVIASTPTEEHLEALKPAAVAVAESPEEEVPAKPKRGRKKTANKA